MIPLMMCHSDMDVVAPHHSAGLTVASVSSQPSLDASHLPHTASMAMQSSSSSQEVQEGESRQLTAATTCAVPSSHHMRVIQNQHIANPGMLLCTHLFLFLFLASLCTPMNCNSMCCRHVESVSAASGLQIFTGPVFTPAPGSTSSALHCCSDFFRNNTSSTSLRYLSGWYLCFFVI